jgi:hypothetical protein
MEALTSLPTWVQVVLALLAAVVLVVLNAGWLLSVRGMLDARKRDIVERSRQESREKKPGDSGASLSS